MIIDNVNCYFYEQKSIFYKKNASKKLAIKKHIHHKLDALTYDVVTHIIILKFSMHILLINIAHINWLLISGLHKKLLLL